MKPGLCVVGLAIGLVVAPSVCRATARAGDQVQRHHADDLSGEQYAFNRQNPRWDAPQHGPIHEFHKPYKPLRQPPQNLPVRQKRRRHGSQFFNPAVIASLTGVLFLVVLTEWLAALLCMPSAALAIGFGLAVGPLTGLFRPVMLFGNLLLPGLAIGIAVVLFETGLRLRIVEMGDHRALITRLLVVGAPVTAVVVAMAAYFTGMSIPLAALFGVLCSVTGRFVNDDGRLRKEMDWESAAIELFGSVAAVSLFEAVFTGVQRRGVGQVVLNVATTLSIGGLAGVIGAGAVAALLVYAVIPERLERLVTYGLVLMIFGGTHWLRPDAGFVALAVMGVALSNQSLVPQFSTTRVNANFAGLISSGICIVLAAFVGVDDVTEAGFEGLFLLIVVLLIARPVGVLLATLRARISRGERVSLALQAPRSPVSLTLAAILGVRLLEHRDPEADRFISFALEVLVGGVFASNLGVWLTTRFATVVEARADMLRRPTPAS